jgi:hypothetical protein
MFAHGRRLILGLTFEGGELGLSDRYRTICRSLPVDPNDGAVYFTRGEGTIHVSTETQAPHEARAQGQENLHRVTWHIPSQTYRDHGPSPSPRHGTAIIRYELLHQSVTDR